MFKDAINFVLDLFFPKKCVGCGKEKFLVCFECLKGVKFLKKQKCPACRKDRHFGFFCNENCAGDYSFDQLIVCANYYENDLVKKILHNFKYKFSTELCLILSEILKAQFVYHCQMLSYLENCVVVPVPIHKKRMKFRGFNQSEMLAKYLLYSLKGDEILNGKFKGLDILNCLKRVTFYKEQAKLGREERLNNLKNAIEIIPEYKEKIRGKYVLLIDDIATTCATLNECSRVLKGAGARLVSCLVLARG